MKVESSESKVRQCSNSQCGKVIGFSDPFIKFGFHGAIFCKPCGIDLLSRQTRPGAGVGLSSASGLAKTDAKTELAYVMNADREGCA